uniref:Uncharacterized protein n=1 Tax=Eutreptiella gymnastica TaxID=73025 RepID=A0A6T2DL74_9EUGL
MSSCNITPSSNCGQGPNVGEYLRLHLASWHCNACKLLGTNWGHGMNSSLYAMLHPCSAPPRVSNTARTPLVHTNSHKYIVLMTHAFVQIQQSPSQAARFNPSREAY